MKEGKEEGGKNEVESEKENLYSAFKLDVKSINTISQPSLPTESAVLLALQYWFLCFPDLLLAIENCKHQHSQSRHALSKMLLDHSRSVPF